MPTASAVILLGTYAAWAGGALFFVLVELGRRHRSEGEWGALEWTLATLMGGALCLPFFFSRSRADGLPKGIQLAIAVMLFSLTVRLWLSAAFRVPAL